MSSILGCCLSRDFISLRYFETYYYVNVIHNVLKRPGDYLRRINDWYENSSPDLFLRSFPKQTLLHSFADFVITDILFGDIDDVLLDSVVQSGGSGLWVDSALEYHGFEGPGFSAWLSVTNRDIQDLSLIHI